MMKQLLKHLCLTGLFLLIIPATRSMAKDLPPARDSIQTAEVPHKIIERQPQFPGGQAELMEYIRTNLYYPQNAVKEKIQGRVIVSFIIGTQGEIENIEVVKSPHKWLSEEAVRLVKKMPKWEPGLKEGKPVRVKYLLPLTFKL